MTTCWCFLSISTSSFSTFSCFSFTFISSSSLACISSSCLVTCSSGFTYRQVGTRVSQPTEATGLLLEQVEAVKMLAAHSHLSQELRNHQAVQESCCNLGITSLAITV